MQARARTLYCPFAGRHERVHGLVVLDELVVRAFRLPVLVDPCAWLAARLGRA